MIGKVESTKDFLKVTTTFFNFGITSKTLNLTWASFLNFFSGFFNLTSEKCLFGHNTLI